MAAPSWRRRRWASTVAVAVAMVVLMLAAGAEASSGDASPEFTRCVASRYADLCGPDGVDDGVTGRTGKQARRLPLALRLTGWSCHEDCEYHCMHQVTNRAEAYASEVRADVRRRLLAVAGAPGAWSRRYEDSLVRLALEEQPEVQWRMVQYHGKWVFLRLAGAQEPVSVLASLANGLVHIHGFFHLARQLPCAFPLKPVYLLYPLLSVLAWLSLAIDHTHNRPWTEAVAQVTTSAAVFYLLFLTIARFWRWASRPTWVGDGQAGVTDEVSSQHHFWRLSLAFSVGFALQMLYLALHWQEQYRMAPTLLLSLVQVAMLGTYSICPSLFPGGHLRGRVALPSHVPAPALGLHEEVDQYELHPSPESFSTDAPADIPAPRARAHRRQASYHPSEDIEARPSPPSTSPSHPTLELAPPALDGIVYTDAPVPVPLTRRRKILLVLVLGMLLDGALRLCSFPPLGRVLDSEALRLLLSIPLTMGLYHLLLADAQALTHTPLRAAPPPVDAPWIATDRRSYHWTTRAPSLALHPSLSWLSRTLAPAPNQGRRLLAPLAQLRPSLRPLQTGLLAPLLAAVDSVADVLECALDRVLRKQPGAGM